MDFTRATIREVLDYFLQSNDPAAWNEFRNRTRSTIRGRCARILERRRTDDLLEDLEQDAYLKLTANDFKVLRRFIWSDDNSIFRYVKVVAIAVTIDWQRKNRIEPEPLDEISPPQALPGKSDRDILLAKVMKILQTFSGEEDFERDKAIFLYFYRWGYTAREIANLPSINLPVKKVENILQKLVRRIKGKLGNDEKDESPE